VAASESMSSAKSDDLLVTEAHATKDGTEMVLLLGSVRKTSVWGAGGNILIGSSRAVWDDRALHFLDGADTTENPEIGIGNPRELLCKIGILARVPIFIQDTELKEDIRLIGSRKSRAALRPALASCALSGANLMVAPLDPPVLVSAS
jgi:hypothetical protein